MTFPRLPDHERAWALVERDDGVVYRLYSGTAGPRLPHDIMHLVVERELRISDGVWAGIAAGGSCQPPGQRAELLADLVAGAAALGTLTLEKIRRLTADKLAALPDASVDPVLVAVAARALQVEAARWARLRVGEELSYDWPGK
ncbi:MAG TPA: hypothetical protein VH480_10380 [Streptosporangiaceae bacterium]